MSLQSTLRYLDPFRGRASRTRISDSERATLRMINQKVAAKQSLNDLADFLFEGTRTLIPCDRIGLAFIDESGRRVFAHYARADYQPLLLTKGYTGDLKGGSLEHVIKCGEPRIIDDLEAHARDHPSSHASGLLVREGVRWLGPPADRDRQKVSTLAVWRFDRVVCHGVRTSVSQI